MLTTNPFSELTALISPEIMQGYIILMIILVVLGTVLDMMHKKSAKYFFENSKKSQKAAKRTVGGGEKASLLAKTVASEVITSSEFCNIRRRISHLLTMYGFIIFVVTTAMMIFGADTSSGVVPFLWHLGALMLIVGGYWFWFFIRVDVSAEAVKWYQLRQADIFILSLLTMSTFGLIWSILQSSGATGWAMLFFVLFIVATTVLFSTVLWSKFAHMFFKPAAAFQKRVIKADGSRENLPADYDLSDPAVQAKFPDIPEYMGKNPSNMGLGIKREAPRHY
ncbi:MAG: adenylyl-sulfate reductase [Thiohalophilus sp.]|uniref:adenylyl-sulfate reductase n=1 Tax=Thiohalophilus sp. TaxID=3028392 RepID=UPI0028708108|nr:adenylyl-sulfate reductase [Thiohalophilus sp.]MDR9437089.1 adenylyl-sulfate reductase [Thiohalophilus sp.]